MFTLQLLTTTTSDSIRNGPIELLREVGSSRVMLIATTEDGNVAGSVQLALGQKLLVHSRYRNQGLGRRLMEAIEHKARQRGITLLCWIRSRANWPSNSI
jgi:GNAT superfamily N-acetyltransferase